MQAPLLEQFNQVFRPQCVVHEPFQHVFVEEVFPSVIYARMLRMLPPDTCYKAFNPKKYCDSAGYPTRLILKLNEPGFARMEEPQRSFWRDIASAIESEALKRTIFAMFRDDVSRRMDCAPAAVEDLPCFIHTSLVRDKEEYAIKPHPDGDPKIVSLLFYLPGDDSQRALGTSLYRDHGRLRGLVGQRFEEFKRFPFLPNSCGGFAVTRGGARTSWHGREIVPDGSGIRDTLQVVWKYADGSLIDDKY